MMGETFKYVVLPPYEFTLLSNQPIVQQMPAKVLPPYEFTLLSNSNSALYASSKVLPPYEFTLLSNYEESEDDEEKFYHHMNLHYSQTSNFKLSHKSESFNGS